MSQDATSLRSPSGEVTPSAGEDTGQPRVLVVDDDRRLLAALRRGLSLPGFNVGLARDAGEAIGYLRARWPEIIVLDIMMPGMDGLSLCRLVRETEAIPILMLTARDSVGDRVAGLEAGADDYLVKPFAFSELVARIQALIRRSTGGTESTHLRVDDLSIDLLGRVVTRQDKRIDLKPLDFDLLEYLMRNAGRVVTKTMIMEHVWGYDFDPGTNVVEARVCRLREKIERKFEKKLIHTIKGIGYVLREDY